MKRKDGRRAARVLALACCALLWACRDNGLPDRNLPLTQAQHREFGYQVYQRAENNPVALAGRHWLRSFPVETIPARLLTQVGNVEGTLLYAQRGEQPPYSRLYSPVSQDRWLPYLRLN